MFFRQFAHKQTVVFLGDDVAVETLHNNFLFLGGVYNAVVRLIEFHVFSDGCVAVEVVLGLEHERGPCAEVAPSEVSRTYEYFLRLLHDGVVYRDVLAFGIAAVDHLLLLWCAVDAQHTLENLAY